MNGSNFLYLCCIVLVTLAGCGRSNHNMDPQSANQDPMPQASTSTGQTTYDPNDPRAKVIQACNLELFDEDGTTKALARLSHPLKNYLDFSDLSIDNKAFSAIVKIIKGDRYLCGYFKELDFSYSFIGLGDGDLLLQTIKNLHHTAVINLNLDHAIMYFSDFQEIVQASNTTQLKHVSMYDHGRTSDVDNFEEFKACLETLSTSNTALSLVLPVVKNTADKDRDQYLMQILPKLPIVKGGILLFSEEEVKNFLKSGIVEAARITNFHIGMLIGDFEEWTGDESYDFSYADRELGPILRKNEAYVNSIVDDFKKYVIEEGTSLKFSLDCNSNEQIDACINLMEQLVSSPVIRSHVIIKSNYTKEQIIKFISNMGIELGACLSLQVVPASQMQEYYNKNRLIAQNLDKRNKGELTKVVKDFLYHWSIFSDSTIPPVIRELCHKYGIPVRSGTLAP